MSERKIKIPTEEEKKMEKLEEENKELKKRVIMTENALVEIIMGGM